MNSDLFSQGEQPVLPDPSSSAHIQQTLVPIEEESDLAALLSQTLSDVMGDMSEEEAEAYLDDLLLGGESTIEHTLFAHVTPEVTSTMAVTNYRPDQAMREASLARKDQWKPGESGEV